jgi:Flp pilus assembly protein TadD
VVARLRPGPLNRASTRYYSATLAYMQQRPDIAVHEAEAAISIQPDHALAHNVLGAALAGMGQRDRARAAFEASLQADPRDPATHSNLATLELEAGHLDVARHHFAEALMLDPGNTVARDGLARLPAR